MVITITPVIYVCVFVRACSRISYVCVFSSFQCVCVFTAADPHTQSDDPLHVNTEHTSCVEIVTSRDINTIFPSVALLVCLCGVCVSG